MATPAHTKYIVLSILFILASVNFTRTALEIVDNSRRLDDLSQEVDELAEEKTSLEQAVEYKKTDEYVEEKARNDLSLIKPGEKVYVIPQEFKNIDLSTNKEVLGDNTFKAITKGNTEKTNTQQWVDLFIR